MRETLLRPNSVLWTYLRGAARTKAEKDVLVKSTMAYFAAMEYPIMRLFLEWSGDVYVKSE